ncbi:GPW/gp25 family protein [Leptothermofonsia sichuanensis E412]|uniref:GPW/gp25 family protein n=1 Tax=Leptothermofonsia sichuanensis TaxID=2917832 RepID=UPI001CA6447A|nr:GPW/gp25 family protein [Leptothermofonsia sichuanensis]QZZ22019.1 GPW/gp25 family protein [Leptothermofonsia sichuanensis E412]
MSKPFLGRGLGFSMTDAVKVDSDGRLQMADYEESVRQSVFLILSTARGERVMRPGFGCGIYDLVFEMKTAGTAGRISQEVQEALLRFEPRIDVRNIQVIPETDSAGEKLTIQVEYQVRATNNVFNLVYPFYLERSPG